MSENGCPSLSLSYLIGLVLEGVGSGDGASHRVLQLAFPERVISGRHRRAHEMRGVLASGQSNTAIDVLRDDVCDCVGLCALAVLSQRREEVALSADGLLEVLQLVAGRLAGSAEAVGGTLEPLNRIKKVL
jgi:hypothetical protein